MAMFVATMALQAEWDIQVLAPALWESLRAIYSRRHMGQDLQSIAFVTWLAYSVAAFRSCFFIFTQDPELASKMNASLSARGSIRKAHDVVTWLCKLRLLGAKGLKPDAIIQCPGLDWAMLESRAAQVMFCQSNKKLRTWNNQATQQSQLTGYKRVALLALLEQSSEVHGLLLEHASEFGTSNAFPEEAFATKSLLPGHKPRGVSKEWAQWLTVTEKSLVLMIKFVDCAHRRKLPGLRTKFPKEELQSAAGMAAFVASVHTSLTEEGVKAQKLVDAFLSGDSQLELQIQAGAPKLLAYGRILFCVLKCFDDAGCSLGEEPHLQACGHPAHPGPPERS